MTMARMMFVALLLILTVPSASLSEPPANWQKTSVMLEKRTFSIDGQATFTPHGTGFIFQDSVGYILITNRHIVSGRDTIFVRFALADFDFAKDKARFLRSPCRLTRNDGTPLWSTHPDPSVDVAAVRLDWPGRAVDIAFFDTAWLRPFDSVNVGEEVYFFGYPLLLLGLEGRGDYPILRSGTVAYKSVERTFLAGQLLDSGSFLLDGFSFPGNSGSPVVVRSSGKRSDALVGIIYGHISSPTEYVIQPDSFSVMACDGSTVMAKPLPIRFTFHENAGLAMAATGDQIRQVLNELK